MAAATYPIRFLIAICIAWIVLSQATDSCVAFGVSGSGICSCQSTTQPAQQQNSHSKVESTSPPAGAATAKKDKQDDDPEFDKLLDADLETLSKIKVAAPEMNFEVTSVSRSQVVVGKTPAAIFVITPEMIRRSGAVTLPDVLRMVPGLQVAKQSNGTWSVGARGSAGTFSRSLQVQIDGRSIYDPRFGGVYWNMQDILLSDIERIEIIRGPGASVWGENAVDGIINITMKSTSETLGVLLQGSTGTELRHQGSFRVGGMFGNGSSYRLFGRFTKLDGGLLATGADEPGAWNSNRLGFRMDLASPFFDKQTIEAGVTNSVYDSLVTQASLTPPGFQTTLPERHNFLGWHLLSSATRNISDDESFTVRSYFDSLDFTWPSLGRSGRITADIDFQHQFKWGERHSFVWGANYRFDRYDANSTSFRLANMPSDQRSIFGVFAQDTNSIRDNLALTLGAKLSYNNFTGMEFQPTARLVWNPTEKVAVWSAVSKSVRLPAVIDRTIGIRFLPVATAPLPTFPLVVGNPNAEAEDNLAIEAGIRGQPTKEFYWDLNAYFFQLDDRIEVIANGTTILNLPPGFVDVVSPLTNVPGEVNSGGMELHLKYGITEAWEISGNYTYAAIRNTGTIANFPRNSVYLQSSFDFNQCTELDLIWRYRDNLVFANTPAYNDMDIRLAWRPRANLEFSLVGRNLLDAAHFEEGFDTVLGRQASQVQRELIGTVQWSY